MQNNDFSKQNIKSGFVKKTVFYLILSAVIAGVYFFSSVYVFPPENNRSVVIKALKQNSERIYAMHLNPETIASGTTFRIIGNGKLSAIKGFTEDDKSNLIILHGVDRIPLEKFIKSSEFSSGNNVIIITSLTLKYLMLECSDMFSSYIENFRKSGDVFNPSGKIFYYLDELMLDITESLSGIILSFPSGLYFSNIKNYGLAHLIQNDFSLNGLENPVRFLEIMHFLKPDGFNGSFEELIAGARDEYHTKFLSNIKDMDFKAGRVVSRHLLPLMPPKKSDKILPLFRVVRLSGNVYFTGLKDG